MKSFRLVDVRQHWDAIKPHLQDLCDRYKLEWRPEDVYTYCRTGTSFLYICNNGFVIVHPRENPYNLKKELFIWIASSWSGDNLIEQYYPDICEMAKDVHCTSIAFDSPRLAFHKLAKQNNWSMMTSYRIPVA